MAIYRDTRYPGRWASRNTNYPQGAFKNKSSPNASDGSYAEQDWLNDWDGFFGRLLTVAGITPNGNVDNASSSQYYDALMTLISMRIPTGMAIQSFGVLNNPLFLLCDGSAKSRTTYANLFSVIGTTYGAGDGSTTFNLPEARGEFLRSADMGRGVDINRTVGSKQGDAIRNITAQVNDLYFGPLANASGAITTQTLMQSGRNSGTGGDWQFLKTQNTANLLDASLQVPTSTENRPRNIALATYIKI